MAEPRITIDYKVIEDMVAQGMSGSKISAVLGFSENTFYLKKKNDPEFDAAVRRGKAKRRGEAAAEGSGPEMPGVDWKELAKLIAGDEEFAHLTVSDLKAVLGAVAGGKHLGLAIRSASGLPMLQVNGSLDRLERSGILEKAETPTFTAWFLAGRRPAGRLVLDGEGGIRVAEAPPVSVPPVPAPEQDIYGELESDRLIELGDADGGENCPRVSCEWCNELVDDWIEVCHPCAKAGIAEEVELSAQATAAILSGIENSDAVALKLSGGHIIVDLDVRFTRLTNEERVFVCELLNFIDEYKKTGGLS